MRNPTWSGWVWGSWAGETAPPGCSAEAFLSAAACGRSYSRLDAWKTAKTRKVPSHTSEIIFYIQQYYSFLFGCRGGTPSDK